MFIWILHLLLAINPAWYQQAKDGLNALNDERYEEAIQIYRHLIQSAESEQAWEFADSILLKVLVQDQVDSSTFFSLSMLAMDHYQRLDNAYGISVVYSERGLRYRRYGQMDKALDHFEMAAEALADELSGTDVPAKKVQGQYIRCLGNKMGTLRLLGYYQQALKTGLIMDSLAQIVQNDGLSLRIKYQIGAIYHTLGSEQNSLYTGSQRDEWKEAAVDMFQESMRIAYESGRTEWVHMQLGAIASTLFETNQVQAGVDTLLRAISLKEKEDPGGLMHAWAMLGSGYIQLGEYEKAEEALLKAISFSNDENRYDQQLPHTNLAVLYNEIGKPQKALIHGKHSLALAEQMNKNYSMMLAHEALADSYKLLGNNESAIHHLESYHAVRDTIRQAALNNEIHELKLQYEVELKEKEIQNLESASLVQTLQLKRKNSLILLLSAIALLMGAIFYLVYKRNQQKRKQDFLELNNQILRLQMNPHFIFNSLASIQSRLGESDTPHYLSKMSKLIRRVLEQSRKEYITLSEEIEFAEDYLEVQRLRKDFLYTIEVEEHLDPDELLIPPMIIQPFLENAVEYGITTQENPMLTMRIAGLDMSQWEISIQDNGTGLQDQKSRKHTSMATQITKERLRNYEAKWKKTTTIQVQNNQVGSGVIVQIRLPKRLASA